MNRGDRWLLVLPLALTIIGVIMVYSSSAILGITRYQDPNHFLFRQLFRAGLGLAVMLAATRLNPRRLEPLAPYLLGVAVFLLLLVAKVGHESNGAGRWLRIGMLSIQPTDVARLAVVAFLAGWLKRRPPDELGFARGLLPPLAVVGVVSVLIYFQPNLSSAVIVATMGLALVFLAGARLRHLAVPLAAAVLVVPIALKTHPYMLGRFEHFVRFLFGGDLDVHGSGWQLDQSLIAIGSGGWFGRGLGGGLQKYLFLPEAHTDFIYAVFAEEMGFVGSTVMLALIGLLVWRGMRAAARARDPFLFLLAGGLTLQLGLYAVINLAVATGLAPTTGVPLPFISYGGSALLANLAAAGVLYRVSVVNVGEEAMARHRWSRERP